MKAVAGEESGGKGAATGGLFCFAPCALSCGFGFCCCCTSWLLVQSSVSLLLLSLLLLLLFRRLC